MTERFKYTFHTDIEKGKKRIYKVIEQKVSKLQSRFDEILMIDINMDKGEKDSTPYDTKSTIILKTKIKNFTAIKINKNPLVSLREAFEAAEIQLKRHLDKLIHRWEKHSKNDKR